MQEHVTPGERFVQSKFLNDTALGNKIKDAITYTSTLDTRKEIITIFSVKSKIVYGRQKILDWHAKPKSE